MPVIRISDDLFKEVQKYAEPLVDTFESALWKALKVNNKGKTEFPAQPISTGKTTPQKYLWKPILQTLIEKGGKADAIDIVNSVKDKMKLKLTEADFKSNTDGTLKIDKAIHFQRLALSHSGLLESGSPRGVWEIAERGRQWLGKNS